MLLTINYCFENKQIKKAIRESQKIKEEIVKEKNKLLKSESYIIALEWYIKAFDDLNNKNSLWYFYYLNEGNKNLNKVKEIF